MIGCASRTRRSSGPDGDRGVGCAVPFGAGPVDRGADGAGQPRRGEVRGSCAAATCICCPGPGRVRGEVGGCMCAPGESNGRQSRRRQRVVPGAFFDGELERPAWRGRRIRFRAGAPVPRTGRGADDRTRSTRDGCGSRRAKGRRLAGTSCGTRFSNVADAGGGLDEVAEALGHASMSSSQGVFASTRPGCASSRAGARPRARPDLEPAVSTTASVRATAVEAPAGHVFATAAGVDPQRARIAAPSIGVPCRAAGSGEGCCRPGGDRQWAGGRVDAGIPTRSAENHGRPVPDRRCRARQRQVRGRRAASPPRRTGCYV